VEEPFLSVIEFTRFNDVRQTEIHTAKPLVPEPSAFEIDMAIEKLKRHILPDIDPIPEEMIKAGGRRIWSETHTLFNSSWYKKDLPEEWRESIIIPTYKKGNKTDCSNYKDMLVLSTTYKFLSNIMLRWLTSYAEEILGNHQYGFRRNKSITDYTFCSLQVLEKKMVI
jgi:hypothetical protein